MVNEKIQSVQIWSRWLRLCHWIIGPGVLFLIFSAWAIRADYAGQAFWQDWHNMIGQLVFAALLLRIVLFFTDDSGHWRQLLKWQPAAMWQTLQCYLSFARRPLPNWYAHNPLWKPLYLLVYILLSLSAFSGLVYQQGIFLGMAVTKMHQSVAAAITVLAITHLVTAFVHDLKTRGGLISAMINGYRYFHYHDRNAPGDSRNKPLSSASIQISPESIKKFDISKKQH